MNTMQKATLIISLFLIFTSSILYAQDVSSEEVQENPEIYFSSPRTYTIGGIEVDGIKHYQENLLINLSGLSIGQEIKVPGQEIAEAIRKYWRHGLFSDVKISASKIVGDKIFLHIDLKERPQLSKISYFGLKKGEINDIEEKIKMIKGSQITPNLINTTNKVITSHFVEKGFKNVEVDIIQKDDIDEENKVLIDIQVNKKQKVKVEELVFSGNTVLTDNKLNWAMKKTNQRKKLMNFFRTKKFIEEEFANDKAALIAKYNKNGYRDAVIVKDSVAPGSEENLVKVYVTIDEGKQYFFRNIDWIGNTKFTSDFLSHSLRISKGDVYNQSLLDERTNTDDDAVSNLYLNNGYLFFRMTPVEVNIDGDSIDLELRISEGRQATINNIIIKGNTKTNEQVVRRELRTKPGQLFSKDDIMRSVRELAQLGHFNPEAIEPVPQPNQEDGTVDIVYNLEERANDQVELSGGWGAGMFVGTLGLSFNNFSMRNIFDKSSYSPLPSGDGQSLALRAQTNGRYYQSYSVSFSEPWLGGKRPNSLSFSSYYSIQSGINQNSGYYSNPYNSYGSSYGGGYGSYGGSGYGSGYGYGPTASDIDQDQYFKVLGASLGLGRRLSWPDDYFVLYNELSFQQYRLSNWQYISLPNGNYNTIYLKSSISRNSIDNPIYTRRGSNYSLSVQATLPYSLINGKDYSKITDLAEKYNYIEYHKWNAKIQSFTPLSKDMKLVLMARAEYGFLGYYNKDAKSPFEKFQLGGDGMSGYSLYGVETVGLRGYENGSLTPYNLETGTQDGNIYTRVSMEVRYPLMLETSSTIYALAFLEGGNAWSSYDSYNPFELKRSAGAGLRIFLPMFGMMGIDWGYGFDPSNQSSGASGSNFHFVIGQQF